MKSQAVSPFLVGHVITPLLRPLPVIFSYAHAASKDPTLAQSKPDLHEEFQAHVKCFTALAETAATTAELSNGDYESVIQKAEDLLSAKPRTLIRKIDQLDLELSHFSEVHKKALRHAYNMKPELFKSVYQRYITPRKLLLVYQSESTEVVPKLQETLSKRCYYEVKTVEEAYLKASLRKTDFVIFAPTQAPISSHAISSLQEKEVPFLVLVNLGADLQRADMVQTRLAGLYRNNGIPILHRPFPAVRLFQKIDRMIIEQQLLEKVAPEAVASKRAAMVKVH
ncbi:MAG: hypothetical protein JSV84_10150 [Gemmatimonadota bacterium]|nr:MAG: hypothetical protein JSV84_10150 [Gemmatimonadota bacterium]